MYSSESRSAVLLSMANLAEGAAVHQAGSHEVPMESLMPVSPVSPR